jgi:hypothetical protein
MVPLPPPQRNCFRIGAPLGNLGTFLMTILIILLMEKSLWKKQLVLSKDLEDLQLHQVVVPTQIKVFWTGTEKLLNHPLKSSKRPTAIPKNLRRI